MAAIHRTSGRWRLGLILALVTMSFWSALPVGLKIALGQMDTFTVTWYRFVVALLVTVLWLTARGQMGIFLHLPRHVWGLLTLAALMLVANYVTFLVGLDRTTPANTQLLMQLAPLMLALGGLWIFNEHYSLRQWMGFAALMGGLALFYRDQLGTVVESLPQYYSGMGFVLMAALSWTIYALLQKQLLRHLGTQAVLLFIYAVATLVLLPFAHLGDVTHLDSLHGWALAFCAINTLVAYGALAESMQHWEASRISAVIALTPVGTLTVMYSAHALWPGIVAAEHITALGWLGAVVVVAGSLLTSLGRTRQQTVIAADQPGPG